MFAAVDKLTRLVVNLAEKNAQSTWSTAFFKENACVLKGTVLKTVNVWTVDPVPKSMPSTVSVNVPLLIT